MELSRASFLPDPEDRVRGRVGVEWIEHGALLAMRQHQQEETGGPPAATWVFGRDDAGERYTVLYFDSRPVSRVYEMSFGGGIWKMWRDDPAFSQRFEGTVGHDRTTITAHWERSSSGGAWVHDFDLTYTKRG